MKELKIGIVEDELIIAKNIARTLTEIGYAITETAISYSEALQMLEDEKPDLVLLDINLSGRKDGIDVAAYINNKWNLPFIFLTANSDVSTLERARKVAPSAYLIKPFTKEELFISIEIAFTNFNRLQGTTPLGTGKPKDFVFLQSKQSFTKVLFRDVLLIESNDNYIHIYLSNGDKLLHRSSITEFATLLPAPAFYRCHRSYIVNTGAVQKITSDELTAGNYPVPVGKDRMKGLLEILGITM